MLMLFCLALDLDIYAFGKWSIQSSSYNKLNSQNIRNQTFFVDLENTPEKNNISGQIKDRYESNISNISLKFLNHEEVLVSIPKFDF
ncbi:hypothetical protein IKO50_05810, partial [bacterium]|nr:hypothetical protein [bacterium]